MLGVLWLMALCLSTGAHEYHKMTIEEIKGSLKRDLRPSQWEAMGFSKNPYEVDDSTAGYPEEMSSVSSESYPEVSSYMQSSEHYIPESSTMESVSGYPSSDADEEYDPSEQYPEESEHGYPMEVGSIRGIPGINFPDYTDIPITSFHCSDKKHIPGFYADTETGCQVFHVCWPHRRESFLCPLGTTFNQAILACDYWYSSNCSLASHYYEVNAGPLYTQDKKDAHLGSMIDTLLEKGHLEPIMEDYPESISQKQNADLSFLLKFLPVKAKVTVYPETERGWSKIVAEASVGKTKKRKVHGDKMHESRTQHEVTAEYTPVYEKPTTMPEYTPVYEKPTVMPSRPTQKTVTDSNVELKGKSKYSHDHVDPSVERIIDQVFDIIKKIVKESEGIMTMLDGMKKPQPVGKVVPVSKPSPLTKLNPRFIIKPVELREPERIRPITKKTLKVPQARIHRRPPTRFAYKHDQTVFQSFLLNVSPSTKKALASNYLKMLKVKSS